MKSLFSALIVGLLICLVTSVNAAVNTQSATDVVLGGVGAGSFVELGPDGQFSFVDAQKESLPGSFMAIRTEVEGRVETRVLQADPPMKAQAVSSLLYTREFPQAEFRVHDVRMGADISVLAFSPLIPHQLPDCALPGFDLIYRFSNPLSKPVTISAVLSWQAPPRLFSSANTTVPAYEPGTFGISLQSRSSSHEVSIAVEPRHREAEVSSTTWQPNDQTPGWWNTLVQTGGVNNHKGPIHATAAVVCVKFTLQPGDQAVIPFGIAMYDTSPREASSHYYRVIAGTSAEAADRLVKNWLPLHILTRDWQYQILFSNLPQTVKSEVIQAAVPLVSRIKLYRDGTFHYTAQSGGTSSALCTRLLAWPMLLSFYPRHAAATLTRHHTSVAAIIEAYQYVLWTGDINWLRPLLPELERLLPSHHPGGALNRLAEQSLARLRAICAGEVPGKGGITLTQDEEAEPQVSTVSILAFLEGIPVKQSSAVGPVQPVEGSSPLAAPALCTILSGMPEVGLAALTRYQSTNGWLDAALWNTQYVVSGLQLDAIQGSITILPSIPGTWRTMRSAIFLPSLLLSAEYRPAVHGGRIDISVERQFAFTDLAGIFRSRGAAFSLTSITIPGQPQYPAGTSPPKPQIFMRVADAPVGFRLTSASNGRFTLTPQPKLPLQVGDILHITVR